MLLDGFILPDMLANLIWIIVLLPLAGLIGIVGLLIAWLDTPRCGLCHWRPRAAGEYACPWCKGRGQGEQ